MEVRQPRKLAVILHADVVGSTALVQRDEAVAHERIQDVFRRFSHTIQRYGGIAHELRGDALVAEFERASDAVEASLAFQSENTRFNSKLGDAIQPTLRIGISLGEVVVADNTVTGEGIVLAQRLEQLASGGGVCIQGAVYEAVPGRLPFEYESLGEQEVKGFSEPVRAYAVRLKAGEVIPPPEARAMPEGSPQERSTRRWIMVGAAAVLVLVGGGLAWFQPWVAKEEPASIERMVFPLPDKPSIAVLPFDNLSGDEEQEYFADGITNDIITDLSKFKNLFVIASNSTFSYKGKAVKVQQVAEELGVRYVLEGSIQRTGERLRINAQLIDAITGHHLWAQRYDHSASDFFAIQEDIVRTIVTSLAFQVHEVEIARAVRKDTDNLQAYDYYQRGWQVYFGFTKEANNQAREYFEKAIELDPNYARAYAFLTWIHVNDSPRRWGWGEDPERSLDLALEVARKAVLLDPDDYFSYWALGFAHLYHRDYDRALAEYERALALNPNDADLLVEMVDLLVRVGRAEQAVTQAETAMRINPRPLDWMIFYLGYAQYFAEKYDDALVTLKRMSNPPNYTRSVLAAVLVRLGRVEEARAVMTKYVETNLETTLEEWEDATWKHQEYLDRYIDDLRTAGLPERWPLPLPDKPSIAVLPFTNISGDAEQEYFADGMTDDLITDLSKISGLFVIARNSSFSYKGKSVDLKQVGRELGVKYVLEGSVRRAGEQIRINAQLIDSTTGGHVWAERYDSSLNDVFALQDKVARSIVAALAVNLTAGEQDRQARKETDSPEAYDAFLRGWAHYVLHTPDDFAEAIPYLENAIKLDPNYGRAHATLAAVYWEGLDSLWAKSFGVSNNEAYEKAKRHLEEALKHPTPLAYRMAAKVHDHGGRWDEAMVEAERAIALDTNDPNGYVAMGRLLVKVGRPAEGLEFIETAMRLDPRSDYLYRLGDAQFHLERYEEAAATLLRATKRNPSDEWNFFLLAAAYGQLGREQEATSAIETFNNIRLEAQQRPYTLADIDYWTFKGSAERERLRSGLRKAGLRGGETVSQRKSLTSVELRSLFPGNTATGETVFGGGGHVYHVPDGKLLLRTFNGQTDQGTWEIADDGRFCRQWNNFGGGKKTCFIYFTKGDEYEYWQADGSRMRGKFKLRLGNPENL